MINKQPKITFIYDRRKVATQKRKAALELRVSLNGKCKFISTGISLYPNQWRNGCIVNCPDAMQLSQILNDLLVRVREALASGSLDTLHERLKPKGTSFIDFCKTRARVRKYGKEKDTQERYDRFIRLFSEWGGIVEVEAITEENIIRYDEYLTAKGMKPYSKWNNYHRFLNSFIRDAIEEGLMQRNPYSRLSIDRNKQGRGIEKYLTPEEFRHLMDAKLPTKSLERVRDVFVFQTYTCLSYTDLRDFDVGNISTVKGMKVYMGSRDKTGKPFTIPMHHKAFEVLEKYGNKLPVISNVKYNEYLKVVAQAAGIDKPVSTHWARHTGATMLLNEGVDMKIVSRICGHSSTKITEAVYAKLLDETVVDAVSKTPSYLSTGGGKQ